MRVFAALLFPSPSLCFQLTEIGFVHQLRSPKWNHQAERIGSARLLLRSKTAPEGSPTQHKPEDMSSGVGVNRRCAHRGRDRKRKSAISADDGCSTKFVARETAGSFRRRAGSLLLCNKVLLRHPAWPLPSSSSHPTIPLCRCSGLHMGWSGALSIVPSAARLGRFTLQVSGVIPSSSLFETNEEGTVIPVVNGGSTGLGESFVRFEWIIDDQDVSAAPGEHATDQGCHAKALLSRYKVVDRQFRGKRRVRRVDREVQELGWTGC